MIVIDVAGVMRENPARTKRIDLRLNELHQFEVRDRIHPDIGKRTKHWGCEPDSRIGRLDIAHQPVVGRPLGSRVNIAAQDDRLHNLACRNQLCTRRAETEYFVIGMRDDDKIDWLCHRSPHAVLFGLGLAPFAALVDGPLRRL
jgi:hypothetical protein